MRFAGISIALLSVASVAVAADPISPCEIDLGGPVLPAYLCAEKLAKEASVELKAETSATLAALPSHLKPGGPYVTKKQLQVAQTKWLVHISEHCRFTAQIPGEPGDWHVRDIYINSCMIRESANRVQQLKTWRACFAHGGGQCMP
jgi:uncharacterized protein YecT (DUF1311 family)